MAKYVYSFAELLPPERRRQFNESEELEDQAGKMLPPNAIRELARELEAWMAENDWELRR
jgi:hypothetical protein